MSIRSDDHFLVPSDEHGEVLFLPVVPFLRGYVVPSQATRRAAVRRMERLDAIGLLLLAAALGVGWPLDCLGLTLSVWLAACELMYWLGMRRLTRRLRALPWGESARVYTRRLETDLLAFVAFVAGAAGLAVIVYGAVSGDAGVVVLGAAMVIWSGRLLPVLCHRLVKRLQ